MQIKIKNIYFTFLVVVFIFSFLIFNLSAAAEGEILVTLTLDTEGQNINALAGEVIIPESFEPKEILDGDSVINFWIEPPRFENQHLIFSGIIPGGYIGSTGKLFSLILQGDETKLTGLNFKKLTALLNDGLGTQTTAKVSWRVSSLQSETLDIIPPEPFTPLVSQVPDLFNNQPFVSFATQDKQSGIDYYEVAESHPSFNFLSRLNWIKTDSPYQLVDTTGRSNIFVRAIDRTGNERLAKIIRSPWYESIWFWIIIILILCVIFWGSRFLRWRRR